MPVISPSTEYSIYGTIPDYANQTVTATNLTTSETQITTTESNTQYLIDCANFTNGYTNHDIIKISVTGRTELISINIGDIELKYGRKLDINPNGQQPYNSKRQAHY